jgi:preprotein translocase subunit SecG
METLVIVIHVLMGVAVCGIVLLQHGKGADMGAAFGSGSAGSLFGASGSANFLSRTTAVLATLFFATSLGLTYLGSNRTETKGVIDRIEDAPAQKKGAPATVPVPAAPASAPAAPAAPADDGSKASEVPK